MREDSEDDATGEQREAAKTLMDNGSHSSRAENMRPWRIVHTESSDGWGGQEHRILAELIGFKQRGAEVWLVAPPHSELLRRASFAGAAVLPVTFHRSGFLSNTVRLAVWLRHAQVDVLNSHSSRDAWVAGFAARLARVPLVVRTRHFDVPIACPPLSRYVYRALSDHILTTSRKITEHLQALFQLAPDRVSTVPTGVDLERFSPTGEKAELAEVARQAGIPILGMLSVIRLAKGHETLFRAMRLLREKGFPTHAVIVGEGPYRPNVEALVSELALADAVTFAGHREDVPEILRALDLLIIPSLHEGVPQVALQALATLTPVIGSDVGGIPTIIRPQQTGRLFQPGDFIALAAAIREALDDRVATRRLAEQGRALVQAEHSLSRMLDQIAAIYCRYLGK